jgi:hypothetical protein
MKRMEEDFNIIRYLDSTRVANRKDMVEILREGKTPAKLEEAAQSTVAFTIG